jgi:flavin reductase (DIM6/NTAB) family NADH-FMN oxidoreductase RutF
MSDDFDAFVAGLDYPVFVVTAAAEGERDGCLIGFATQCSIDPPRLLVCLSEANRTTRIAAHAEVLAVHLLDSDEHGLAEHFGGLTGDEVDKLSGVRWHAGPAGVPLLEDAPRRLVGRVLARHPLGDHIGHLLAPLEVEAGEIGDAMSFQDVTDVEAGHPA